MKSIRADVSSALILFSFPNSQDSSIGAMMMKLVSQAVSRINLSAPFSLFIISSQAENRSFTPQLFYIERQIAVISDIYYVFYSMINIYSY
jgi:hypothetical protein